MRTKKPTIRFFLLFSLAFLSKSKSYETEWDPLEFNGCLAGATINSSYANGTIMSTGNIILLDVEIDMDFISKQFFDQCEASSNIVLFTSHMGWEFSNKTIFNYNNLCDSIGPVYDPGLACGTEGSPICALHNIPGSTALKGTHYFDGQYHCNPQLYAKYPFTCQGGDHSGKLGKLIAAPEGGKTEFVRILYDSHPPNPCNAELNYKSVAFKCEQGYKIFCVPWTRFSPVETESVFLSFAKHLLMKFSLKNNSDKAINLHSNLDLNNFQEYVSSRIDFSDRLQKS